MAISKPIIRTGLETLYFSGAHLLLGPFLAGVGSILTLHHVRPQQNHAFQPNRLLEVTPEFLETVVRRLRRARLDIVSLDEAHRRLVESDFRKRFVCLTFDDGYRDNLQYAYPILKKYDAPFAIYVPTSFPDRLGELWWLVLEAVIAANNWIGLVMDGEDRRFNCGTPEEKHELFDFIYWWLRSLDSEGELRRVVRELAARYRIDGTALCDALCMTWDELEQLAADPLVTVGAHTVNHMMLKKLPERDVSKEMRIGASVIEAALGKRPLHFSYPIGDATSAGPREFQVAAQAGFKTAVTTRPGVLFPEHRDHLMALPRISLHGEFQRLRYVKVLMSGAPTAMLNRFRRVNAA